MTVVSTPATGGVAAPNSLTRRLSTVDRLLPLWIIVAMTLGIVLGRAYPDC